MKKIIISAAVILVLLTAAIFLRSYAELDQADKPAKKAIILYDQSRDIDTGSVYAAMLSSALGHFDLECRIAPVNKYNKGDINGFDAVFYLGEIDEGYVPLDFLRDISKTDKTVVWFKSNLNQLQADFGPDFIKKYGFSFMKKAEQPAASPELFDVFYYKGQALSIKEMDSAVPDLELAIVKVVDPQLATIVSSAKSGGTGEEAPYIVRSKNFWFIADMPFSFLESRARYFIFCDALHDMLGIEHKAQHRALLRLEDINPSTNPGELERMVDFLQKEQVPFSMGVIPFFRDQTGKTFDRPVELTFADSPDVLGVLQKTQSSGASVIMHGVTHQTDLPGEPDSEINITSIGYEFWDIQNNTPVKGDSKEFVINKLEKGKAELSKYGLRPVAFETPHYTASALDYRTFAKEFDFLYDEAVYHLYDTTQAPIQPEIEKQAREQWVNQFFPYEIRKDYYGLRIIPSSTIDSLNYDQVRDIDSLNKELARILKQIEAMKVVRDGYVSFYIHPFLIKVMEDHNIEGFAVLKKIIDETRKDFEFIDIKTILKK